MGLPVAGAGLGSVVKAESELMKKGPKKMRSAIDEGSYQALLADIVRLIKEAQRTAQILPPRTSKMRPPRVSPKEKRRARKP